MYKFHRLPASAITPYMSSWMLWARRILDTVARIINHYFTTTISDYQEQDKNRATLLVWEVVLAQLDAIDGTLRPTWTQDLRHHIRMAYIKYHSNINYHTSINFNTLYISDAAMVQSTGDFEDPPDSNHIRPRLPPKTIHPFDFEHVINSDQLLHGTRNQLPTTSTSTACKRMTMSDLSARYSLDLARDGDPTHSPLLPYSVHYEQFSPLRTTVDTNPNCLPYDIAYRPSQQPYRDRAFRAPPANPVVPSSLNLEKVIPVPMDVDDSHLQDSEGFDSDEDDDDDYQDQNQPRFVMRSVVPSPKVSNSSSSSSKRVLLGDHEEDAMLQAAIEESLKPQFLHHRSNAPNTILSRSSQATATSNELVLKPSSIDPTPVPVEPAIPVEHAMDMNVTAAPI